MIRNILKPRSVALKLSSLPRTTFSLPSLTHTRSLYSLPQDDTIYAVSSGNSAIQSGVAVVRVSGPHATHCLAALLTKPTEVDAINKGELSFNSEYIQKKLPKPRLASLQSLYCPKHKELIDKALVLFFPNPKSFTGEDVVELHVHGSRAVLNSLFESFEFLNAKNPVLPNKDWSFRLADRGEFSRRAFENGKMDLTEVEGLSDLLASETRLQKNQALYVVQGHLREVYDKWRGQLAKCLAHTEAVIDFGDDDREDDIDHEKIMSPLYPLVRQMISDIKKHLNDGRKGEIIREGLKIALAGKPNAGKSSLINSMARRPAAIVSPIAGTTRDIVEVRMDIGGIGCLVSDTAGLRADVSDEVEEEGVKRARKAFRAADIGVYVLDLSDLSEQNMRESLELFRQLSEESEEDRQVYDFLNRQQRVILLLNKVDLLKPDDKNLQLFFQNIYPKFLEINPNLLLLKDGISCASGAGFPDFEKLLVQEVYEYLSLGESQSQEEGLIITRQRHRFHLINSLGHLERFMAPHMTIDLGAEELRLAMVEIGKITGHVDVEELLDIIFRDFCIGK